MGLEFMPRQIMRDERGAVLHCLRADELQFPLGEVYFSQVHAGATKGWKRHSTMWQRFTVPQGFIQFVFYDDRPESTTPQQLLSIMSGPESGYYGLITVPARIWYSFRAIGSDDALIVNCASEAHRAGESEVLPLAAAPWFVWPPVADQAFSAAYPRC